MDVDTVDWDKQMLIAVCSDRDGSPKNLEVTPLNVKDDVLVVTFSPRRIRRSVTLLPRLCCWSSGSTARCGSIRRIESRLGAR